MVQLTILSTFKQDGDNEIVKISDGIKNMMVKQNEINNYIKFLTQSLLAVIVMKNVGRPQCRTIAIASEKEKKK